MFTHFFKTFFMLFVSIFKCRPQKCIFKLSVFRFRFVKEQNFIGKFWLKAHKFLLLFYVAKSCFIMEITRLRRSITRSTKLYNRFMIDIIGIIGLWWHYSLRLDFGLRVSIFIFLLISICFPDCLRLLAPEYSIYLSGN